MIESRETETAPLLTPGRKRVLAALGAALLVHLILLLCLAALAPLLPNPRSYVSKPDKPITLKLERPDETPEAPMTEEEKKNLDYLPTNPNQESAKPPEKPAFQSDKDTIAASEKPEEKGDGPLPSQEGRELPFFHFDTKPFMPGEKPANFASKPAAPSAPTTPVPGAPETQTAPPRPQPNLTATPPPTVGPRDIALLPPQVATPPPTPPPQAADRSSLLRPMMPDSRQTQPSIASPGREATPGYQPQTEKTKMVGGVSNRGESSAAALGTPLGRYQKAVSDAIGNRWYFYANRRLDLSTLGTVRVSFFINKSGKAENVRILTNSSNETVASYSIQSIIEARIPPMPPEVSSILANERMPVDYSFAIY